MYNLFSSILGIFTSKFLKALYIRESKRAKYRGEMLFLKAHVHSKVRTNSIEW